MELPQFAKDRISELRDIVNKPFCDCCDYDSQQRDKDQAQKEIDIIRQCKEFIYEDETLEKKLWE